MKEFWALRLPDGDIHKSIGEDRIAMFDSQQDAVEYAEGQPELDYAVAVKFVQVAR